MYAVIESGGKQYRVSLGERVRLETLAVAEGDTIAFDKVLAVSANGGLKLGTPHLEANVSATVLEHGRGDKVRIIKFRRRQNYHRTQGHRQNYTEVQITAIDGVDYKAPPKVERKPPQEADASTEESADIESAVAQDVAPESAAGSGGDSADDLTKINGIGPVLVEKLAGLGVTTFAQIAALTPEEVEKINNELSFKGRIEREEWIEQAKKIIEQSGSE